MIDAEKAPSRAICVGTAPRTQRASMISLLVRLSCVAVSDHCLMASAGAGHWQGSSAHMGQIPARHRTRPRLRTASKSPAAAARSSSRRSTSATGIPLEWLPAVDSSVKGGRRGAQAPHGDAAPEPVPVRLPDCDHVLADPHLDRVVVLHFSGRTKAEPVTRPSGPRHPEVRPSKLVDNPRTPVRDHEPRRGLRIA